LIRQLQFVYQTEPDRADELVKSKAMNYVLDWSEDKTHEHKETVRKWHEPWQENETFEKRIMNE